jgi:hypothetical protein
VGIVVDKVALDRFSQSILVSPANLHSTNFSTITITYHPGLAQWASSGLSTRSPTAQIKKIAGAEPSLRSRQLCSYSRSNNNNNNNNNNNKSGNS